MSGLGQGDQEAAPSSLHSRVEPVDGVGRLPVTLVWLVPPAGRPLGAGAEAGADVSTVQLVEDGVPTLPAASTVRVRSVCWPSARPEAVNGLVHVAQAAPSSEHW